MTNDILWMKSGEEKDHITKPDFCGPSCVHFHGCKFPKSCPVLIKTERAQKEKTTRRIIP